MARQKNNGDLSALPFDGYPNAEYTRQRPKPPLGTIVWRPVPRQENGATVLDNPQVYLVDDAGKLHRILVFELTQAELNARQVRDPQRLEYLFDPYRNRTAAEPWRPEDYDGVFDDEGRPTQGALMRIAALMVGKFDMPESVQRVTVQREPGED